MAADILDIFLAGRKVGTINGLGGDRTVFTFDDAYADDPNRPTLSLSLKDAMGDLIRDERRTQTRLSLFFSNLLPEAPPAGLHGREGRRKRGPGIPPLVGAWARLARGGHRPRAGWR